MGTLKRDNFLGIIPVRPKRRHKWLRRVLFSLLSVLVAGLLAAAQAFLIEPNVLSITRLNIIDGQLPASWDGRVIAYFSDVHVGDTYPVSQLDRVARAINQAEPDLILFGGDLVDYRTSFDSEFSASCSEVLGKMQAPLGKFAIIGNHDNRLKAELALAARMFSGGGFELLINQSVELDGILLGGMDESYFGQPDLEKTFGSSEGLWRLLLMHQPDYAAALPADSARLTLSGHSHNGQVTIFGYPPSRVYQGEKYTYGLYTLEGGRQLAVTRGLGMVGLRARFWAPPEIMLITLHRN